MLKEFKTFAMRGNVVDMAVGIIIGGAFGTIVKSLVSDVIMPPIGLMLGGVDFSDLFITLKEGTTAGPYATLASAQAAGAVTISYGLFVNAVISFLIVAFSVFLLIKGVNKLQREKEAPSPEQRMPALFFRDRYQGHSLPSLHIGNWGIMGGLGWRHGAVYSRCNGSWQGPAHCDERDRMRIDIAGTIEVQVPDVSSYKVHRARIY